MLIRKKINENILNLNIIHSKILNLMKKLPKNGKNVQLYSLHFKKSYVSLKFPTKNTLIIICLYQKILKLTNF